MISWYFIMNHVINYSFIIISWYFIINILHVRHFRVPWRTLALRAPEAQRRQPRRVQAGTSVEQQKLPQLFHCLRQRLEKNCEKKMSHKYIYICIFSMELWKGLRPYMDFTLSIHYPHVYIYNYIYIYPPSFRLFSLAQNQQHHQLYMNPAQNPKDQIEKVWKGHPAQIKLC